MFQKYAETFRELRESRNMTLQEVVGKDFSITQLSNFENGRSNLTIDKFFTALQKIDVPIEEFLLTVGDYSLVPNTQLIHQLHIFYFDQDLTSLHRLLKNEQSISKEKYSFHTEKMMIQAIIYNLNPSSEFNATEKKQLTEYLTSIEYWGYFEMVLFNWTFQLFDPSFACKLGNKMLEKEKQICKIPKNKQLFISCLLNISMFCIEKNQSKEGKFFLKHAKELLNEEELLLYERSILHYINGFYQLKTSQSITVALELMVQSIAVFEQLGSTNLAKMYREFLLEVCPETNREKALCLLENIQKLEELEI